VIFLSNRTAPTPVPREKPGVPRHGLNLEAACQDAFRLAATRLAACEAGAVCCNSKAGFDAASGCFRLDFFGQAHQVHRATGAVTRLGSDLAVPLKEQVLILHYLLHAKPSPLTGRAISFMEIPGGGAIYCPSFKLRAIDPMVAAFASHPDRFAKAASRFGGVPEPLGDQSFTLNALPLVPITYVVWAGDDEVPSAGTILFDASAGAFLPVEDLVLAASFGTYRLVGAAKEARS